MSGCHFYPRMFRLLQDVTLGTKRCPGFKLSGKDRHGVPETPSPRRQAGQCASHGTDSRMPLPRSLPETGTPPAGCSQNLPRGHFWREKCSGRTCSGWSREGGRSGAQRRLCPRHGDPAPPPGVSVPIPNWPILRPQNSKGAE